MKTHIVAPSDLSYMYDRCPRCYWLKLRGIVGSAEVLPGVFRDIDRAQKAGITLDTLRALGIPATEFIPGEKVMSKPMEFGGSVLVISGYTDRRVRLEDSTIGVIDFKTSKPRSENMTRFWRAMNGYRHAIEESADRPEKVSMLSLVTFNPQSFSLRPDHPTQAFYKGTLDRVDVENERERYAKFLTGLGEMLARENMPDSGSCDTCRHVAQIVTARLGSFMHEVATHPELGADYAAALAAMQDKVRL